MKWPVVALIIGATMSAVAAQPAVCVLRTQQAVILASTAIDPDVFVWDTRSRLLDYAAGQYGDAKSVLEHTTLAKPGTKAVVIACETAAVHPKYGTTAHDAIGVKITSGPNRGRYGWVASNDVHVAAR